MAWWIYKCNSRKAPHQVAWGDWDFVFDRKRSTSWGNTEWAPDLEKMHPNDLVIAYQSNRNELVGIAKVDRFKAKGNNYEVYLSPMERIGAKVRPLKKADAKVAAIPALRPGPIQTIYAISSSDAKILLDAAGSMFPHPKERDLALKEKSFIEGEKKASKSTVRSQALRRHAKEYWGLKCYCCGFDFRSYYGDRAEGAAIVHHLDPFARNSKRSSTVEDVRIVCANCHYVIHLEDPEIDVDELKAKIQKRWTRWSLHGTTRKGKLVD